MNKHKTHTDIAILGGGASGLAAAVGVKKGEFTGRTLLIDRHPRIGKKLLSTGNGRCNLSNTALDNPSCFSSAYFGSATENAATLLKEHNCTYIRRIMRNIGLITKDENGLIYPYSNSANSVLDIFKIFLEQNNADQLLGQDIQYIKKTKNGFVIESDEYEIHTKKLIMANGGKASAKLSSDGSGYKLAKALGYKLAPLFPSLAPVKVESNVLRSLKGIRQRGAVSLFSDETIVDTQQGEIQFAEDKLSGICVFQLSRYVNEFFTCRTINGKKAKNISLCIDLFPGIKRDEFEQLLINKALLLPELAIGELFSGILVKRVGMALIKQCGFFDFALPLSALTTADIHRIAATAKQWEFKPKCISDFNQAQVTAGGVLQSEIDFKTMCAKNNSNLFFTGELVDLDGLCGGYNLHWAWVSGLIAGENAVKD